MSNHTQETIAAQSTDAVYNNLNELLTNGNDVYSHDDGNQNERQSAMLGGQQYLWDTENRLIAIKDSSSGCATRSHFIYDTLDGASALRTKTTAKQSKRGG